MHSSPGVGKHFLEGHIEDFIATEGHMLIIIYYICNRFENF